MRIAITGATGFVGRALTARLHAEGLECTLLARQGSPLRGNASAPERFLPALGDVDERWAEVLKDTDVLVHLATSTHQGERSDPASVTAFEATNVGLTKRLAHGAAAAGIRHVVFMSSIKVCGERSWMDSEGHVLVFSRESQAAPEGPYGASKWQAEQALQERCGAAGIALSVFRPPLIYGVGMRGNLWSLLRILDRGMPLPLASVRNQRSLLHRDSLVDAVVRAIHQRRAGSAVYTLADLDLSTPELIRSMARGLGKPARLFPFPPRLLHGLGVLAGRASMVERLTESLRVESTHAIQELGWQPSIDSAQAWADIGRAFRQGGAAWQ
ncbi:MAG: NAD-dependent epimerase/dehydratase family protein [Gammaproteobacteria bacterium]|nr:NAD-dependent epimerase/dehydratase family protein [Gammaproteobacteria bacterium]